MKINFKYVSFVIIVLLFILMIFNCERKDKDESSIMHTENIKEETSEEYKDTVEITEEDKKIIEITEIENLGEFKLTAYCPCSICCGKWAGSPTASGVIPTANHTIAVDTNVIPFGTEVIINNKRYKAEDTGSAIKGKRIDIYFEDHQEALEFGVQYADVFQLEKPSK